MSFFGQIKNSLKGRDKLKRRLLLFVLLLLVIALIWEAFLVFGTPTGIYRVPKDGGMKVIDEHGVCRKVTNNRTDFDVMVPAGTADEWSAFRDNPPVDVVLESCDPYS